MGDAFSKYHPGVNFLFFAGAMVFGVLIQHPAYLTVSLLSAAIYYLLLNGSKGLKFMGAMAALFLVLTAVNPLFNTYGETELFSLFGRPYTLEALYYGAVTAGMFILMLLWFGCYNKVLTSDKFISLFGSRIPSLSLLLVMVMRMVPNLLRKANQISGARRLVGKAAGETASLAEKLRFGGSVLGALTTWSLEGGIVTGDAMRARGYGAARRTGFLLYRMNTGNWVLLGLFLVLGAIITIFLVSGSASAAYTPVLTVAPVTAQNLAGLIAYGVYLLIPTILSVKEALQWHISRSRI